MCIRDRDYLVRDVARRHGQTRVGAATAYIRSDDEAVLAALLADRSLARAVLRRIAPTVLVSQADPATLVEGLRAGGYSPARESFDGTVVVERPATRRARPPAARPAPEPTLDVYKRQAQDLGDLAGVVLVGVLPPAQRLRRVVEQLDDCLLYTSRCV